MSIDVSVLVDKLNSMSTSDIEGFLLSTGIRGETGDEHQCVIARWIRQQSGEWVAVGVWYSTAKNVVGDSDRKMCVAVCEDEPDIFREYLPISDSVAEFIRRFDDDQYPNLVLPVEDYE